MATGLVLNSRPDLSSSGCALIMVLYCMQSWPGETIRFGQDPPPFQDRHQPLHSGLASSLRWDGHLGCFLRSSGSNPLSGRLPGLPSAIASARGLGVGPRSPTTVSSQIGCSGSSGDCASHSCDEPTWVSKSAGVGQRRKSALGRATAGYDARVGLRSAPGRPSQYSVDLVRRKPDDTTRLPQGGRHSRMRRPPHFAVAQAAPSPVPIINGGEHAWVLRDPRFAINPNLATCPNSLPKHEYSAESILELMRRNGVDKCVIIHVCYYGRDNSYATYCIQTYPLPFFTVPRWGSAMLSSRDTTEVRAQDAHWVDRPERWLAWRLTAFDSSAGSCSVRKRLVNRPRWA